MLSPLQSYLRQCCVLTSVGYETEQRCQAAKQALAGNADFTRRFPVEVAASGGMEKECIRRLTELLQNETLWLLVKPEDYTNKSRATAFITISAAIVGVRVLLEDATNAYPLKQYKLLSQPEYGDTLRGDADCARRTDDEEFNNSVVWGSNESLVRVAAKALPIQTNTITNETLKANLRKFVKSRPQSHQLNVADLSAVNIGQTINTAKKMEPAAASPAHADCDNDGGGDAEVQAPTVLAVSAGKSCKRKRSLSGWNMFASKMRTMNMTNVSAA